jgi:hypothetical protein
MIDRHVCPTTDVIFILGKNFNQFSSALAQLIQHNRREKGPPSTSGEQTTSEAGERGAVE